MIKIDYKNENDILNYYKKVFKFFMYSTCFILFINFFIYFLNYYLSIENYNFLKIFCFILLLLFFLLTYFNYKYSLSLNNIEKISESQLSELYYFSKTMNSNNNSLVNYFENIKKDKRDILKYDYYYIKDFLKKYEKLQKKINIENDIKKQKKSYDRLLYKILNKKY